MKICDFLKRAKAELSETSTTPQLDAELLLSFCIQKSREFCISRPRYLLSSAQKKHLGIILQQRKMRRPMAYILGEQEFFGRMFCVDERVLIPRPETECLLENILEIMPSHCTVIDVGTGSGCIAISIALEKTQAHIIALDISPNALDVAKQNAKHYNANITFLLSDLLEDFEKNSTEKNKNPRVIIANLPYVPEDDQDPSVSWEPKKAIYSGKDGLSHYTRLFLQLQNICFEILALEFHPPQKEILEQKIQEVFPKKEATFFRDYSGAWRYVIIR